MLRSAAAVMLVYAAEVTVIPESGDVVPPILRSSVISATAEDSSGFGTVSGFSVRSRGYSAAAMTAAIHAAATGIP